MSGEWRSERKIAMDGRVEERRVIEMAVEGCVRDEGGLNAL